MSNPLQRTEGWFREHHGRITSSRAHAVMYGGPKGWLSLMDLMRREMEGEPPKELYTDPIVRGLELEAAAIASAELITGLEFEYAGFVRHPAIEYLGASSDALADGGKVNVEAKCYSKRERHLHVYQTQEIPREHLPQVQLQMAVHEVDLTLFVSYFPEMPHWKMQTVILEVKRDQSFIDRLLECAERFIQAFRGERPLVEGVSLRNIPKLF